MSLESIAEVPDWQVAKMKKIICPLTFFSQVSAIAITMFQMQQNHRVFYSPLIVLQEIKLVGNSQTHIYTYACRYMPYCRNNIIHSNYITRSLLSMCLDTWTADDMNYVKTASAKVSWYNVIHKGRYLHGPPVEVVQPAVNELYLRTPCMHS